MNSREFKGSVSLPWLFTALLMVVVSVVQAQSTVLNDEIKRLAAPLTDKYRNTYQDLHSHPELSHLEFETSKKMAAALRELGFEVTTDFGGNGVIGVFRNGPGKVLMLRTDMDALPVQENTGLPFASVARSKNAEGLEMPVMHACGHDLHMTVWMGTLAVLTKLKKEWKGTILAVAQPAEEVSGGSDALIEAGLFTRFPKPDAALCFHVNPELPAGTIGFCPGPVFAGISTCSITVFGRGGHGAMPHKAIDPVVLSARIILDLQTIVSREINPVKPAVITVGAINGGTKSNIIPEQVKMLLTIRYFDDAVVGQIHKSINRITRGAALAAGLPDSLMPYIEYSDDKTPPVLNDEELVSSASGYMKAIIGEANVIKVDPATVAEDFGKYGRTPEKIPVSLFWLGGVNPDLYRDHLEKGTYLPYLHSSYFAPDFDDTFRCGVTAMSRAMIGLFREKK